MISINPTVYFRNSDILPYLYSMFYTKIRSRLNFLPCPKNPFNSKIISPQLVNQVLYDKIITALEKKTPLMMGRLGASEHDAIVANILYQRRILKDQTFFYSRLCNNAGFFQKIQTQEQLCKDLNNFSHIYLSSLSECDVLGTWEGMLAFEKYLIDHYANKNIILTQMRVFGTNTQAYTPFTYAFKDTKVLVIHPFAKTIQMQYKIYDKLFANKRVLPSFHLKTFKAIQTAGGESDVRFQNWFEALDWISEEISKLEFDIALLGCGAYGFPLAARIKNMGKIAIHFGGPLQLLFGIKGKRWEIEQPQIGKELFNQYWVYPNQEEKIKNSSKIENGCYW